MNVEGGLRCFCVQSFDTRAKVFGFVRSRDCIPSKTGGVLTHEVGMSICESPEKLVIFEVIVSSLMFSLSGHVNLKLSMASFAAVLRQDSMLRRGRRASDCDARDARTSAICAS